MGKARDVPVIESFRNTAFFEGTYPFLGKGILFWGMEVQLLPPVPEGLIAHP